MFSGGKSYVSSPYDGSFIFLLVCFYKEDLCMLNQTRQTFPGNKS